MDSGIAEAFFFVLLNNFPKPNSVSRRKTSSRRLRRCPCRCGCGRGLRCRPISPFIAVFIIKGKGMGGHWYARQTPDAYLKELQKSTDILRNVQQEGTDLGGMCNKIYISQNMPPFWFRLQDLCPVRPDYFEQKTAGFCRHDGFTASGSASKRPSRLVRNTGGPNRAAVYY